MIAIISAPDPTPASRKPDVLMHACIVFGSHELANSWLRTYALALGGARPIDILDTEQGCDQVEALLTRIEYCVYT